MKKFSFDSAKFLGSMLKPTDQLLDMHGNEMPEIALVGRSNVGKSSLINHLLSLKKLAFVSSKPGKTVTLNFFKVDERLILVDLPGYGFAKRSHEDQASWGKSIHDYFTKRKSLKVILLLVDSRREFCEEDKQIALWAEHHQKSVVIVFTKSDTIKEGEKKALQAKAHSLNPSFPTMYYSIKDGKSRDFLITTLNHLLIPS
ncbi:ribosome biogenesis GTP-binding protein YihA/YsxC [Rhabdochlamydiaceae symbiont of Dictyostelium giganteum]|uniref:ribosome biogenesis GTP-binding protein YihA/YsxC n=1 Tax=Rhabdochlamydiaceae symbiont of Dictyostelium giganteum TaxID=3342349 RepID=UPI00384BC7FA